MSLITYIRKSLTRNRILLVFGQLWAIPILIIIRLLRPLIVIRIGYLLSEYFGHYSGNVELYLCERDLCTNRPSNRYIDLWFNFTNIQSNTYLEKIWKSHIIILPRVLLAPVYRLNKLVPFGKIHQVESTYHDRDVKNLLSQQGPHIVFSSEEEEIGRQTLSEMGIPEGALFVCLNVRDESFHNKQKISNYRNANIETYMLAAEKLTKSGFYVIRMGKKVKYKISSDNKKILDYASSPFRNDFMDIFLGAKCFFAISTSSGWDNVPGVLFRRPVLYTNVVPISQVQSWNNNTLAIFKRHWLISQNRFLTQSEIFYLIDKDFNSSNPHFDKIGIEIIDNTAKEILDATMEMVNILKSKIQKWTDDENRVQKKFWSIYRYNLHRFNLDYLHGEIRVRIGTKFLVDSQEFIDNSCAILQSETKDEKA